MMTRRREADAGYSLMEMLIVMGLFALLMTMVFSILIQLTYQARDELARARSVEQARLGVSQIDRQVRSGNLIKDPADDGVAESGVPQYYSMRIFTQEGGNERCAQWRVITPAGQENGNLEFRSWDPNYPSGDVTDWFVVAQNSVAPPTAGTPDPDDPTTWPPFWIDTSINDGTEAQNIRITLRMKDPEIDSDAAAVVVSTIVTGRNTVFGYSDAECDKIPPI